MTLPLLNAASLTFGVRMMYRLFNYTHLTVLLIVMLCVTSAYRQLVDSEEPVRTELPDRFFGERGNVSAVYLYEVYKHQVHHYYENKEYEKAFKGYLKLAKSNHKFSQYSLAFMYASGQGTPGNLPEAYAW